MVLLLTEEMRNPIIQEKAIEEAGLALRNMECYELALRQYQQGLKINPNTLEFRRQEAFHLGRLKKYDEAIVKLEQLLNDEPTNIDAITHLARIYIDTWEEEWSSVSEEQERLEAAYDASHWLKKGIDIFLGGYRLDPSHTYSGIMALSFSMVLEHLARQVGTDSDPELESIRGQLPMLKGAVQFALDSAVRKDDNDFWAFFSHGYLAVTTAEDPGIVTRAYKKAIAQARKNTFALKFTLAQLELWERLAFRPEYVKPSIALLTEELNKLKQEGESAQDLGNYSPSQVFIFAGHMIDRPDRAVPRFPPEMEDEASDKIAKTLDWFKADGNDLAIATGAACGGISCLSKPACSTI
ncbi:hypothetical protein HYR99_39900 [Candidatus Poribacteria bacterium]|nr:hypothetical protein [Candidatus Poribacteria bacterium]